jgi:GAG-pre-integrase domain
MQFGINECTILNSKNEVVGHAPIDGNLYTLQVSIRMEEQACISTITPSGEHVLAIGSASSHASIETWHQRLGHTNYDLIHDMVNKGLVKSMNVLPRSKVPSSVCKLCVEGKHVWTPIPKEMSTHADTVLGHVFSNVWGLAPIATPQKEQYYVLFIDDKSHYTSVALIKNKSDTLAEYKSFVAHTKNETGT